MVADVCIRYTKWDGRRHWAFDVSPLGTDRFGWWLAGRAGIPLQRGDEAPIVQPHDFVMLVPDEGCWVATWNPDSAFPIQVYVDVTSRPVRTAAEVTAVDLDLDVIRFWDGRVELVDQDEFAEHQVIYDYPPHVIEQALSTAAELMTAVTEHAEPFDTVGTRWLAEFIGSQYRT